MALKTTFAPAPAEKIIKNASATAHGRMYRSTTGTRVMALKTSGSETYFMNLGGGEGSSQYYLPGALFTSVSFPLTELPKGTQFTAVQD